MSSSEQDPERLPLLVMSASSSPIAKSFSVGSRTSRAIAAAEADEGPFPSPLKTMLLAEAFGTCLFVQLGGAAQCVALYLSSTSKSSTNLFGVVGFVWGAALATSVYLTAAQSGGHLNPAVSFSFALVRPADFRFRKMVPYWCIQLLAGAVGAALNLVLFHQAILNFEAKNHLVRGTPQALLSASALTSYYSVNPNGASVRHVAHALFVEAFGTSVLTFAMFCWTHRRNPVPGSAVPALVGIIYGLLIMTLGPLTGASLNPARDVGPRIVLATLGRWGWTAVTTDWLPYLVGPMIGGPVGAFVADKVLMLA